MVKDICNAVGIEVPDEGIKEEEDPSHARAMENSRPCPLKWMHSCVSAKRNLLPIPLIHMILTACMTKMMSLWKTRRKTRRKVKWWVEQDYRGQTEASIVYL
jgi:hypothetical protein